MDLPHHGYRASKQRGRGAPTGGESVLFDDTSASGANAQGYYTPGYNMAGPSNDMQAGVGNLFADPMASAAVMYGSSLANQGKDMVNKEGRPTRKRFALLVCLSDQQIHVGEQVEILLCRGHQIRDEETHDPHVPVHASGLGSSLPSRHSANTKTGRQRAGSLHPKMIFSVLCGLLFGSDGYFVALAWSSCALMFFIVRSLKMKILTSLASDSMSTNSSAKPQVRMYITVATALFQPAIIYWLTFHLVR
ncbi:protein YIF1A isoform X4 [Vanacampus margaritifer]